MNIVKHIKRDRVLSLAYWRYQLLHWCFNIEVKKNEDGKLYIVNDDLPDFLYTHYCPLFNLTNLILVFSPFILMFKICGSIFSFMLKYIISVSQIFGGNISSKMLDIRKKIFHKNIKKHMNKDIRRNCSCASFLGYYDNLLMSDFDYYSLWRELESAYRAKPEKEKFTEDVVIVKKEVNEQLKNRIYRLISYAQSLMYLFLYAFYVVLGVASLFVVWWFAGVVFYVSQYITQYSLAIQATDVINAAFFAIKVVGLVIIGTGIGFVVIKSFPKDHIFKFFDIIGSASKYTIEKSNGFYSIVVDTISNLYEDNCPPVTIKEFNEKKE